MWSCLFTSFLYIKLRLILIAYWLSYWFLTVSSEVESSKKNGQHTLHHHQIPQRLTSHTPGCLDNRVLRSGWKHMGLGLSSIVLFSNVLLSSTCALCTWQTLFVFVMHERSCLCTVIMLTLILLLLTNISLMIFADYCPFLRNIRSSVVLGDWRGCLAVLVM